MLCAHYDTPAAKWPGNLLIPVTIVASVLVTGLACLIPIKSAVEVDPALVLKGE